MSKNMFDSLLNKDHKEINYNNIQNTKNNQVVIKNKVVKNTKNKLAKSSMTSRDNLFSEKLFKGVGGLKRSVGNDALLLPLINDVYIYI